MTTMNGDVPIKLFQNAQKYFRSIDISPSQQLQKKRFFHWKYVLVFIYFTLFSVATLVFFLFEAKSMAEYSTCFYTFTSLLLSTCCYLTIILHTDDMFRMIEKCEKFIENRKLTGLFYYSFDCFISKFT